MDRRCPDIRLPTSASSLCVYVYSIFSCLSRHSLHCFHSTVTPVFRVPHQWDESIDQSQKMSLFLLVGKVNDILLSKEFCSFKKEVYHVDWLEEDCNTLDWPTLQFMGSAAVYRRHINMNCLSILGLRTRAVCVSGLPQHRMYLNVSPVVRPCWSYPTYVKLYRTSLGFPLLLSCLLPLYCSSDKINCVREPNLQEVSVDKSKPLNIMLVEVYR